MIDIPKTIVERAFELARDGSCQRVPEVRKMLKMEGFTDGSIEAHLSGKQLRTELTRLCRESTKASAEVLASDTVA
jgi:hypothetical protein